MVSPALQSVLYVLQIPSVSCEVDAAFGLGWLKLRHTLGVVVVGVAEVLGPVTAARAFLTGPPEEKEH